jgi:hypothetical protein
VKPHAVTAQVPASTGGVQFWRDADGWDSDREDRLVPFSEFWFGDEYEPFHSTVESRSACPPSGS